MRRRRFIEAAGGTGLLGLVAGCIGGQGPGDEATETEVLTDTEAPTDAASPTEAGAEESPTEAGMEESPTETEGPTDETDTSTETGTEDGDFVDIGGEVGETPDGLEVTNHELYETNGEVGLQGTVQNTSEQAYEWVEVEVTLQDDQGEILYEFIDETEEEDVANLEAGAEWQFDVVFEEAQMSEVSSYSIELDGYQATDADFGDIDGEIDDQDENLEILSTHFTRQESETFVTGSVKNVGQDDIENVEVSVTLYDDDDNELFDFNDTVEEQEQRQVMVPGEIWDFRIVFEDIDMNEVARYVVTAESSLV